MGRPPAGFVEAIAWARARKVALPADYYGPRFRELRLLSRTISGLAAVDQVQAVLDALDGVLARGGTFRDFQRAVDEGGVDARLPRHRLALVFRTNIQSAYAAGRWRQAEAGKKARPYLMYLAVNDARTRPSHRAMHGHIARVDDPWWKTHHPLNGFNCRCTTRTLTEAEAKRRGIKAPPAAAPDPGWDYNPGMEAERGLAGSARRKKAEAHPALAGAVDAAMDAREARMHRGRVALGEAWERLRPEAERLASAHGIEPEHAAALMAYTDRSLDVWPLVNRWSRTVARGDMRGWRDDALLRAALLAGLLDEALARLPKRSGVFLRGVDPAGLGRLAGAWRRAHARPGRVVLWGGFTSVMDGAPYDRPWRFVIETESAVDIAPFSRNGEPELLLPRGTRFRVVAIGREHGYIRVRIKEVRDERPLGRSRRFSLGKGDRPAAAGVSGKGTGLDSARQAEG